MESDPELCAQVMHQQAYNISRSATELTGAGAAKMAEALQFARENLPPDHAETLTIEGDAAFYVVHQRENEPERALSILKDVANRAANAGWPVRNSVLFHALEIAVGLGRAEEARRIGDDLKAGASLAPYPEIVEAIPLDVDEWIAKLSLKE